MSGGMGGPIGKLATLANPLMALPFQAVPKAVEGLNHLLPKPPSQPTPPTITPPPVIPLPNDAAVQAAKKKQIALAALNGGRASTILSGPESGDRLGG